MVFLPNPPVEDAAGGEADKSLRLPCEMRRLFLWGCAHDTDQSGQALSRNQKNITSFFLQFFKFIFQKNLTVSTELI